MQVDLIQLNQHVKNDKKN